MPENKRKNIGTPRSSEEVDTLKSMEDSLKGSVNGKNDKKNQIELKLAITNRKKDENVQTNFPQKKITPNSVNNIQQPRASNAINTVPKRIDGQSAGVRRGNRLQGLTRARINNLNEYDKVGIGGNKLDDQAGDDEDNQQENGDQFNQNMDGQSDRINQLKEQAAEKRANKEDESKMEEEAQPGKTKRGSQAARESTWANKLSKAKALEARAASTAKTAAKAAKVGSAVASIGSAIISALSAIVTAIGTFLSVTWPIFVVLIGALIIITAMFSNCEIRTAVAPIFGKTGDTLYEYGLTISSLFGIKCN